MSSPNSFADLGVPSDLVAVLDRQGISQPFPIQSATIPDAIFGRDVLGRAPTGSGKTLAFGLPLISGLEKAKPRQPRALILSPTRELAEQIRRELEPLATARGRSVLAVYGGVGFGKQTQAFSRGVDLLVACPGRLLDLLEQREVSLEAVEHVVVDEADRMADMGFLPDVRRLLDQTRSRKQTVFFSATLGREVKVLTDAYQHRPVTHEVGEAEPDLTLLTHRFIKTEQPGKVGLAAHLVDETGPTIIFCRTRHGVDRVARQLKNAGVKASHIHGGRSQNQRDTALDMFTRGKVRALIATDVAARGIHVDGVACVIHFDPPEDEKAYVHRSGRTARAGASGLVVSFMNPNQLKDARKLQRDVGIDVDFEESPRVDLNAQAKAGAALKSHAPSPAQSRSRKSNSSGSHKKRTPTSHRSNPKKKHAKKVAATESRTSASRTTTSKPRRPSKQKQHSAKQRNQSASNHRGGGRSSRSR